MLHLAIKGEINCLLTALRLNKRWAADGRFTDEISNLIEHPITKTLKSLSKYLGKRHADIDTVKVVSPFVAVICSAQTTGQITARALTSLYNFLLYGLNTAASGRSDACMALVAKGITNCRFEDTRKESDESVLVKLLELITLTLKCDSGLLLKEKDAYKMFLLCYRVGCRDKASELLRSNADDTLARLILSFFGSKQEFSIFPSRNQVPLVDTSSTINFRPAVLVMNFLCDLVCSPQEVRSSCILALSLINIMLEVAANTLASCPMILSILQRKLCKYLRGAPPVEDLTILSLRLRVIFNLFNSMKKHLKLQLEQILISTHLHILGDLSSSPDQQEIALESLLELSRESSILLHLYVSYDADLNCSNLFEDLFISLANSATPLSRQPMNLLNYLAMDCVLEVVYFVSCRCFSSNQYELLPLSVDDAIICNGNPGYSLCNLGIEWLKTARDSTAQMLQQRRRAKKRRSLAADYFNAENKWMSKVESLGILPVNLNAKLVAQFLHENPRLDKRRIGELLSKGPQDKYPFHAAVFTVPRLHVVT